MTTDFSYGGQQIVSSGPFKPSGKDMPNDARTRVETYADIASIPNPHVGLKITVKVDETNNNKMTDYIVKSLKTNSFGAANSLIDEVVRYSEYLGVSASGGSTVEIINDLTTGGTDKVLSAEQGKILKNEVNTVISDYLGNKKLVYLTQTEYNSLTEEEKKDESVVYNITDATESGEGLTSEQAQQLTTAYEHSQSPHISTEDVNNAVSTYVTEHKAELKGDKGDTGAVGTTPTLAVGSVTTLAAGSNATVTMSENNNEYTLNFGIPKGAKGDAGTSGDGGAGLTDEEKQNLAEIPTIKTKVEQLAFHVTNAFENKVANFLGDSQTEVNSHKTKIYHDWVKEILGLSKVNNYGIGGTTIAKKNESDNTAMSVRYANMDNNADLICVMGGVNDRWHNTQLGKFGDTDAITFYGAMETLCDGLLTKYPGKTIIFITPTEQNNYQCNQGNTTGYTVAEFANAMKRVCAKYSIPVFDANTCSGICPLNNANATLYTSDKLHLNDKGHEVLGNKLSKFILNGANVVMINNDNSGENGGGSGGESTGDTYGNIVVSKSTATINEGGTDTFTVKLDKAPTNSQIVNISSNNSDVTLSANTLTFDSSNYSTLQEVTINVAEDSDAVNDNCTLTLSSNNVSSKTITITITDNDSASDIPTENQFIGKTVTVTKNYQQNYAHIVALLNVDDDMRSESTYDFVLNGSNVSNMSNTTMTGGPIFSDKSGEISNGEYVESLGGNVTFTQTVSDGKLTISSPTRRALISTNYVKVPIVLIGSVPYSFQIDEIKIIVNNVERNILKLGSFFASDKEQVTVE